MPVIDLAREPSIGDITASICIVGSGPAGGFLACELAQTMGGIVVLEAGGSTTKVQEGDIIRSVALPAGASADIGFAERLGGTSVLWSGRLALMEAADLASRAWVPHSGWPIAWDALAPYYERAATLLGLRGLSEFATDRHALAPPFARLLDGGAVELKPFVWLEPPFRVEPHLRKAATKFSDNLAVLTSARVRTLHEREGSSVVDYASVAAPDGRSIRVYARVFVLAAGGIGTPRILLNSRSCSPRGLGNGNDLVGRFLSTHPKADLGSVTIGSGGLTASPLFRKHARGAGLARLGLGLSTAAQETHAGLNHCVQMTPQPKAHRAPGPEAVDAEDKAADGLNGDGRARRNWLGWVGHALGTSSPRANASRSFALRAFLDQCPNPDCRVSPVPETDRYGDRKVQISWSLSDADRRTAREFLRFLEREFARHGIGRVVLDPAIHTDEWPLVGIHSHFMGSTRMSESPKSGVVDRNCRVFGCENLYIAGPSTFPTSGYANPFLTITALSLRLADHLKRSMDAR